MIGRIAALIAGIAVSATLLGPGAVAAADSGSAAAAASAMPSPAPPAASAIPFGFPTPPPLPPAKPVTETFFGTSVTDPYRYFEDLTDPTVQDFFKSQNDYTRAVLDRLGPAKAQLHDRIAALDNAGTSVANVNRVMRRYFYQMQLPGENTGKLYVREAAGGTARLLIDPDRFVSGAGKHATLDFFVPSFDGSLVAFGVSEGGSENDVTRVVRTSDGHVFSDAITRTTFGVTGWDLDGKSFYYNRLPLLPPGAPPTEREEKIRCYRHVMGADPDRDRAIFGYGVNPGIALAPTDSTYVSPTPVSKYAFATVAHGVGNEVTIYAEPVANLIANRPAWRKLVDVQDAVTNSDVRGNTIYLLTHAGAPRFKVTALRIDQPQLPARTIVPQSDRIVAQIAVAGDGLYVRERDGGLGRIVRLALDGAGLPVGTTPVVLPYDGAITAMTTDPQVAGATFGLTTWTHSLLYYATRPDGSVFDTRLKPLSPIDASAYTSAEVLAKSADGTMVPLSLIFHKGIARDGSHPTYLEGYGSYGFEIEPGFGTTRFAWLEHNGVYAICHPRGGGWYGEGWHEAAKIATKQHTIDDFIACAQYVIANGYTTAAHLAGEGTSAGGITIGGAITQRPDLFAAALDVVGVSDALRSEFSSNGPANIPEFGTVKDPVGFKALYGMDAYQHVKDGTPYPAVMAITGINDRRVPSWELAKFVARLQAASTSGRPVLFRVDFDTGHGFLGASREQGIQLQTDEYSFLLWQLGDPAFAGIPQAIVPK